MKETAEQKLIRIGSEWLRKVGIRGMKLRRICEEADVSPGTFTAYFRTLRHFNEKVLEHWYEPLKSSIEKQSRQKVSSIEVLKAEIRTAIAFVGRNTEVLVQLCMDAAAGEQCAQHILRQAEAGHIAHIKTAIRKAQDDGYLVPGDVEKLLFYLIGAIGLPVILFQAIKDKLPSDIAAYEGLHHIASVNAMRERMDWALKGISL